MLPSRGLRLRRLRLPNGASTLRPSSSPRLLSTTSRATTSRFPSPRPLSQPTATIAPWRTTRLSPALALSSMRFASTAPAASSSPCPSAPPPTADASQASNLDTITFDMVDVDATSTTATEGIGYLASLGPELQYWSWGPTTLLQNVMEITHFHADMPWWAAILATSFVVRLVALPLAIKMQDVQARTAAMAPLTKPLLEEVQRCSQAGDLAGMVEASKQMRKVRAESGISNWPLFAYMGVQTAIGICGFRLTRAMASLPVPGLDQAGFLWLTDLTVSDPFLIAPVSLGLIMHFLFRYGGETGNNALLKEPSMRIAFLYVLPGITSLTVAFQPGTTVLFLTVATAFGVVQAAGFRNPAVRRALGIAPLYKSRPGEELDPFAMFRNKAAPSPTSGRGNSSLHYQAPIRTIDVKAKSSTPTPQAMDAWKLFKDSWSTKPAEDPKKKAAKAYEQRTNVKSRARK